MLGLLFGFLVLLRLLWVFFRKGFISYEFLFLASVFVYLILIPELSGGMDAITGATARASWFFYISLFIYCLFYLLGLRLVVPKRYLNFYGNQEAEFPSVRRNKSQGAAYRVTLFFGILLCAYSLISRNIFNGGSFLFTIIGFDLLLVAYFLERNRRRNAVNFTFFCFLLAVFLFAGFRYRLFILAAVEAAVYLKRDGRVVYKGFILAFLFVFSLFMAGVGQVRSYGNISNYSRLFSLDLNPVGLIVASGEQTVSFATISVVERVEELKLAGLEPFSVLLTYFIPRVIYPEKIPANYLTAYFEVSYELRGTGAAMHDLAQAILMFGFYGLPAAALLLGSFIGFFYRFAAKRSPNFYFSTGVLVLFAFLIPTRGYLAQQVTWALTFLGPLILASFLRRVRF